MSEIEQRSDSEEYARELDSQIRTLAHHAHVVIEALAALVEQAKADSIHTTLGYASWTAYIADALDGQWKLERDKRGEVVRFLDAHGMSSRAIAKALGIGKGTVHRELEAAPRLGHLITGTDGRQYSVDDREAREDGEESDEDFLARMQTESEARGRVIHIPATVEEAAEMAERITDEMRRLERILFDRAFIAVQKRPPGALRDAYEFGLYIRWRATRIRWLLNDGMSIEEIAEHVGESVDSVLDHLDAPQGTNEKFFADVLAPTEGEIA
ncbi:hypothetical protein [Mycobacterium sp. 852014-52144_SCH5372336]|uniref:hypothetical protein n=1 Tax=Mycobacterium sp. 852014-52144_SCH5372336 TaxID=1834115 RepID=UPI0008010D29|nr:hypothetical protein [Mycobacterium sp. 852014-52144_SCH5372336]OBB76804.1 hypothetical protein A5759_05205 [Mycobacterium sp. 852014-52144_SCH5372336]